MMVPRISLISLPSINVPIALREFTSEEATQQQQHISNLIVYRHLMFDLGRFPVQWMVSTKVMSLQDDVMTL